MSGCVCASSFFSAFFTVIHVCLGFFFVFPPGQNFTMKHQKICFFFDETRGETCAFRI